MTIKAAALEHAGTWPVQCTALAPLYVRAERLDVTSAFRSPLPIGTIVHVHGSSALASLATLALIARRSPWAVPCLTLPHDEAHLAPLLEIVTDYRHRLAVLEKRLRDATTRRQAIVAAVRRRPRPGPESMARFVAERLAAPEWVDPLFHQFRQVCEGVPATRAHSVAFYSRFFGRRGRYTARDWRAIARLAQHCAASQRETTEARTQASLPVRRAERHARRFLQMAWIRAKRFVGWEWVLEAALRTGGYVTVE